MAIRSGAALNSATHTPIVEAQLLGLANELDGVTSEVIRLQAMSAQDVARHVPELQSRLQRQAEQFEAFERQVVQMN